MVVVLAMYHCSAKVLLNCSGWALDAKSRMAVIVVVIDNLGKGAAGQAIQNLNVMAGFNETDGLDHLAVVP